MRQAAHREAAASARNARAAASAPRRPRRRQSAMLVGAPARASASVGRPPGSAIRATSARGSSRHAAAVVDREQEAPGQRCEGRIGAERAVELDDDRRRSRASAAGWRPASGLARTLRTQLVLGRRQQAAGARAARRAARPRPRRSPRICRLARDVELDEAAAEPRGARRSPRADATTRGRPGSAHAREPAVLRRVQREHAGAAILAAPACSLRRLPLERVGAQPARPSASRQSDCGHGVRSALRRGMIVWPVMTRCAVPAKTRPIVVQSTAACRSTPRGSGTA